MANKQLSEMMEEELKTRQKEMTVGVIIVFVVVILLFISAILMFIRRGVSASIILPFAFLPIAIINFLSLKKIKAELALREK